MDGISDNSVSSSLKAWQTHESLLDNLNVSGVSEGHIFDTMRRKLSQNFSELTSFVNQRKLELDRKIDFLELEYTNKNKQIEKDKQTMTELREMTEQKLGQNSLLDVQSELVSNIDNKIVKLETELRFHLELTPILNWNFEALRDAINQIDLDLGLRTKEPIEDREFSLTTTPLHSQPTATSTANLSPKTNSTFAQSHV